MMETASGVKGMFVLVTDGMLEGLFLTMASVLP